MFDHAKNSAGTWVRSTWKKLLPLMKRPVFWVVLIMLAGCTWVAGSSIRGRLRAAPANPMDGSAEAGSQVLLRQVAALKYAGETEHQTVVVDSDTPQVYDGIPFVPNVPPAAPANGQTATGALTPSGGASGTTPGTVRPGITIPQIPSSGTDGGAQPSAPADPNAGGNPAPETPGEQQQQPAPETPPDQPQEPSAPADPTQAPPTQAPTPDNLPVIYTSLADNTQVTGSFLSIELWPQDLLTNSRIPASAITVLCNNAPVACTFDVQNKSYYNLPLQAGENSIILRATDSGGRTSEAAYKVISVVPEQPSFTISVEASTVGLGYLIPPTSIVLEEGKTLNDYLEAILTANGYAVTGEESAFGYYLVDITKEKLTEHAAVPEDLLQHMNVFLPGAYNGVSRPDALGEFDFALTAGWLYSINGQFPGDAISLHTPAANDVIRFRFSLAQGRDIGGYVSAGEDDPAWGKEW